MTARGEVFLRALGADADRLHPQILAQMSTVAPDEDRAEGVFEVAGSRFGRLSVFGRPFVGPRMLVTRFGRDVPFLLTVRCGVTASGQATLDTTREFRFPGSTQYISDRLTTTPRTGIVHNVLGARGRVEMLEHCSVTDDGALRMRTRRVALRFAGRRIPLAGIFGVDVDLEDGWDEDHRRRTIRMRATNPLFGTVLEYRGWYRYLDQEDGAGRAPGRSVPQ